MFHSSPQTLRIIMDSWEPSCTLLLYDTYFPHCGTFGSQPVGAFTRVNTMKWIWRCFFKEMLLFFAQKMNAVEITDIRKRSKTMRNEGTFLSSFLQSFQSSQGLFLIHFVSFYGKIPEEAVRRVLYNLRQLCKVWTHNIYPAAPALPFSSAAMLCLENRDLFLISAESDSPSVSGCSG